MVSNGDAMKRFPIVLASVALMLFIDIACPGIAFAQYEQFIPPNATAARLDRGPKPITQLLKFPGRVTDENFDVAVVVKLEVRPKGKLWNLQFTNKLRKYHAFYRAIETAAKKAKVEPAVMDGKPAKISTYATFVFRQKDRKRSIYFFHHSGLEDPNHGLEYIGPQVIGGYQAFRNATRAPKVTRSFSSAGYVAVINYEVAENGRAKNVRIIDEKPRNSKWGPQFVAALERLQFIPATVDDIRVRVVASDYIGERERFSFEFSN